MGWRENAHTLRERVQMLIPSNKHFREWVNAELKAQGMSKAELIRRMNKGRDNTYEGFRLWLKGDKRQIGIDYASWISGVLNEGA
jgi:hypothetical protein